MTSPRQMSTKPSKVARVFRDMRAGASSETQEKNKTVKCPPMPDGYAYRVVDEVPRLGPNLNWHFSGKASRGICKSSW